MTSQGSPRTRFERALAGSSTLLVRTTAAELGHKLDLADALAVTLFYVRQAPELFERAALRWHSRLCLGARLSLDEAQLTSTALRCLGGPQRIAAGGVIAATLKAHGERKALAVLERWPDSCGEAAASRPPGGAI